MKYNICTVVNEVYLSFLYYFVKSGLEKCSNLESMYILYTGETLPIDEIYSHPKIKIIKHDTTIVTKNIWDDGWIKNVNLKSQFLKKLANEHDIPTFLIDADCYFLNEFINEIDLSNDLVVCHRKGHEKPYIGSFVGLINTKKCISFIEQWQKNIESIKEAPRETPALIKTIKEIESNYKIQKISDVVISCVNYKSFSAETKILHFKGSNIGNAKELLDKRLENLKSII